MPSRRRFLEAVAAAATLGGARPLAQLTPSGSGSVPPPPIPDSDIGSLYPFVQQQADRSPLELSFLHSRFTDLAAWQPIARARVLQQLSYEPPPAPPAAQVIRREDRGDYVQEYLTFQTTPDIRVPAYVLIPKKARLPAPGIVALHCHGGFYVWGKEKLVDTDREHPALAEYKQELYHGRSIASELARLGYVVIVIDAFYWGERRCCSMRNPRRITSGHR